MSGITYEWTIVNLKCSIVEDGLSNVVKEVHWRYKGTDINGTTSELYGVKPIKAPESDSFIEYSQLNLSTVSQWLESILYLTEMKQRIADEISELNNPTTVDLPLPS